MRFAEVALLALPFVVFLAWRLLAPTAGPPRVLVIAVTATVVAMAGLLLGLWYEEAEPPGTGYAPARLEGGRILPSHVVPIAPAQQGPGGPGQAAPGIPRPSASRADVPGQVVPSVPAQQGPGVPGQTLPAGAAQK